MNFAFLLLAELHRLRLRGIRHEKMALAPDTFWQKWQVWWVGHVRSSSLNMIDIHVALDVRGGKLRTTFGKKFTVRSYA